MSLRMVFGLTFYSSCIYLQCFGATFKPTKTETEANSFELIRKWDTLEDYIIRESSSIAHEYRLLLNETLQVASLTRECERDILYFINDFEALRKWAVEMYDANGGINGGLLVGTLSSFGSFDECLDVKTIKNETTITGKYCLVDLKVPLPKQPKFFEKTEDEILKAPRKTEFGKELAKIAWNFYNIAYRFGVCLPSSCQIQDVQYLSDTVALNTGFKANVYSCEIKTGFIESIKTDQYVVGGILLVFALVVVVASLVHRRNQRLSKTLKETEVKNTYLEAISIMENWAKLIKIPVTQDEALSSLNGLRFFTVIWILFAHTMGFTDIFLIREYFVTYRKMAKFEYQFTTNAFLSVDSFVYITGVLVAYQMSQLNKEQLRVKNLIMFQFRRVYRLLLPCVVIIGFIIVLPIFGSGPMWQDIVGSAAENCRLNYWATILGVSNYLSLPSMCLPQAWYISMDIQLYPLAFTYLYIRSRNTKLGQAFLAFLMVASSISTVIIMYLYNDPPVPIMYQLIWQNGADSAARMYTPFYNHVGIYAIGLFVGTYVRQSELVVFSRCSKVFGWIFSTAGILGVVFGIATWHQGAIPTLWAMLLYGGLHRLIWGLSLTWLTLYCRSARKSTINRILSWRGFIVLNRLTFAVYLLQELVIYLFNGNLIGNSDNKIVYFVWLFVANTLITFLVAIAFRLLFEAPLLETEKLWFSRIMEQNKSFESKENDNGNTKTNLWIDHERQAKNNAWRNEKWMPAIWSMCSCSDHDFDF